MKNAIFFQISSETAYTHVNLCKKVSMVPKVSSGKQEQNWIVLAHYFVKEQAKQRSEEVSRLDSVHNLFWLQD